MGKWEVSKLKSLWNWLRSLEVSLHAAHTCYFVVLSAFPALVLMLGLLRYTTLGAADLMDLAEEFIPAALHGFLWRLIYGVYNNTSKLVLSISALTALWSSGRGIYGLVRGLNRVYGVEKPHGWLQTRLKCTAYTLLFLLVLILTLVLHVFGTTILEFLKHRGKLGVWVEIVDLRFFLLVLMQTLLFCAMYMFLPGERNGFRESLPGALAASFGWMGASWGFSAYVVYFPRYGYLFGSVYAVALLMLWLYVCVSIVFYGGALNRVLKKLP